jgi:hypothetical protein
MRPEPHEESTSCWCRPAVHNVGVVFMVMHRKVYSATLMSRYFYTDDGEYGWATDVPFVHRYPEDD